ncbi:hypothetical protein KFE96_10460 [Kordiimonas sp. SCSIO 12603]|uniref:hypothetical protein n=1 Tax=Kordiimonas sp. SCSIO 12603 TaxID=2829596 RepID=UPI002107D637|nr:hypothetical protein [Kordiimonas sp. SCSIO 12603]UTW57278.1 hypothetical protein KFE96_10460 [Kordiimonas sp. SCSIO 12603]
MIVQMERLKGHNIFRLNKKRSIAVCVREGDLPLVHASFQPTHICKIGINDRQKIRRLEKLAPNVTPYDLPSKGIPEKLSDKLECREELFSFVNLMNAEVEERRVLLCCSEDKWPIRQAGMYMAAVFYSQGIEAVQEHMEAFSQEVHRMLNGREYSFVRSAILGDFE